MFIQTLLLKFLAVVIFVMTPSCTHAISRIFLCGGILKRIKLIKYIFSVKYACEDATL